MSQPTVPYPTPQRKRVSAAAVASLVVSILALLGVPLTTVMTVFACCCPVVAVTGVPGLVLSATGMVLGMVGVRSTGDMRGQRSGRGLAVAGLIIGILAFTLQATVSVMQGGLSWTVMTHMPTTRPATGPAGRWTTGPATGPRGPRSLPAATAPADAAPGEGDGGL